MVVNRQNIKRNMADMLEIPPEVALNSPRLVLTGSEQLTAENHQGIIEYLPGKIVFKTAEGQIEVLGEGLSLAALSAEQLMIEGQILALCLVGEGQND